MNSFQNFIEEIFRVLAVRNIAYLVLRNYEGLPEETTNDVDILIDPSAVDKAKTAVLDAASETGWSLSNIGRFSCLSLFFFRPDTLQQTHIDLMHGNLWHSMVFADHRAMLAARMPVKCFFKPTPADEAWGNLATRLLYGGNVKEKYRPFIQSVCAKQPDSSRSVFSRFLGNRTSDVMVSLCADGRWNEVEHFASKARFLVVLKNLWHPCSLFSRLLGDAFRLADRFRNPPGLIVGIASPVAEWRDKMTNALTQGLRGTFYPERTFRWNLSTPSCHIRRVCRRNAFHGGLSILDFPCASGGVEKGCDILFSDGENPVDSCIVPPGGTQMDRFIIESVLRFLESRTRDRHER